MKNQWMKTKLQLELCEHFSGKYCIKNISCYINNQLYNLKLIGALAQHGRAPAF